jgi:hypothetical protein
VSQLHLQTPQLAQSRIPAGCRCAEFETEVGSVRDIVMVLGKAIGKQPRGQELPSHEDPVWAKLGPLGGVQFALEVIMKHTRVSLQCRSGAIPGGWSVAAASHSIS